MAAGGAVSQPNRAESAQENGESGHGEVGSLHERLVAYVHTLEHGSRRGVLNEHSYARARLSGERGAASPSKRARALLAPQPLLPPPDTIDIVTPPSPPPVPPDIPILRSEPPEPPETDAEDPAELDDWEARVTTLAPSPAHKALADAVAVILRDMRLARLASGGGVHAKGEARTAASRLRRALAPLWLATGTSKGAPGWLHSALQAYLPRYLRRLYEEIVGEMRRSVPQLAERLTSSWAPPPASVSARSLGPVIGPETEPWLVWVSSGCASLDARWERKLATQIHTRVLRAPPPPAAPPEAWCAATAGAVREQLTDALAEAGDRSIILGGIGAGAALCLLLARGAGGAGATGGGVRGAVLVAPALRTAEGSRGARDDALNAVKLPLLMIVGTHAHDSSRAIANEVCERGNSNGCGPRRVLEVHGADSSLRLARRHRRRLALPQQALDHALVEECVRWAVETAEGETTPEASSPPAPPRSHLPTITHIDIDADEEYSHLPSSVSLPVSTSGSASTTQGTRAIEITEGRVVSRSAGGTPLTLLPPRRSTPASSPAVIKPATPAHSVADIMQMPIVFADDNATDSSSTGGSPVTVTSGKARGSSLSTPVKMTRVILAKRGGRGGPVTGGRGGPVTGGRGGPVTGGRGGPVTAGRPRGGLLLRRGMRVISRHEN